MNVRQEKFVSEYISNGGNAAASAKAAGYSARSARVTGAKLLRRAEVREAIDGRLAELKSERIVAEREALEYLSRVMRGEEIEVVVVACGKKFELPPRCHDRLRAAEMLLRIYGSFDRDADTGKTNAFELYVASLTGIWAADAESESAKTWAV